MNQRKLGVVLSYLSQAVHILSGLVYTPIMLRLLGQSEYGLYQLVFSVVSCMSLLSFGFSSSYIRFYSRLKAKDDDFGIAKLNGMFLSIFIFISLIALLCGCVMTMNIQLVLGSGLTLSEYGIAKVLMVLMVVNLALTFPNSVFDAITSSQERFFFQKLLVFMQNALNPFITLPLLIMGYGSVAMVTVTTGLTLARLIMNIVYCKKKLHVSFVFRGFDFKLLKEMWIFTAFIFINMIVDQINWSVDKFLLGRMIGTTAVAVYGVGGQLNTLYLQLSTSISTVFIPKVNKIVAETNDNLQLTQLFTKIGRIQFIILGMVLSGMIFLGQPFIKMWAGREYDNSYWIALFLMVPATVPLIQNLGIEIQRAKNMHKTRSLVYLFIAISNVFVSIPCIKNWGEVGASVGTAISLVLGNGLLMNWYYHKKIGLNIIYFWKNILKFLPSLVVPTIVGIYIMKFATINNIASFVIYGILFVGVYSISMWILGFNSDEKNMIFEIFRKFKR